MSDTSIDKNLRYFANKFREARAIQVVRDATSHDAYVNDGISVVAALDYLQTLV